MSYVEHLLPVEVGSGRVHLSPGVRAGPWVFVSGIRATDSAGRLAPGLIDPKLPLHGEPRHEVEAGIVLDRARDVLAAGGTDFANVVRTDQFYSNWRAVDHYQGVRRRYFGSYIPPSTSILEEELLLPGADIDVSMIAIVPGPGRQIEILTPPELEIPAGAGFAPVVCVNDLVFVAGFMAAHQPGDLGGIAPEAQVPPGHLWKGTRIQLETAYLIEKKIIPALAAAGASLESVLKAHVYVADVTDIPAFNEMWRRYFPASPPATLLVPTSRPGFAIADATIEINLVAVRNSGQLKKETIGAKSFAGYIGQPAATRAGDLLFVSGLMSIDQNGPVSGVVADSAAPHFGTSIEHQMEHIIDVAEEICSASGTSLRNLLRAQHFHTKLEEFYPAYQVWMRRLPAQPLPLTALRVPAPLPARECTVLVDLCFYVPPATARP